MNTVKYMEVRKAQLEEIDEIMDIFVRAKEFMINMGNPNQWVDGYPFRDLVEYDIAQGNCYVCCSKGKTEGVFVFIEGEDPTYIKIFQGEWLKGGEYGTIHRLATAGRVKGLAEICIKFCFARCGNLRADTHEDNMVMQHLLEKNGFEKCGKIRAQDGGDRIAYQKVS